MSSTKNKIEAFNEYASGPRLSRQEYFMKVAETTALRGTCDRAKVGAIAVKNNRIIMTGYNGSPPKFDHCDELGHLLVNDHCIRTVHAEQNIITQCARFGISLEGVTIYVTHQPCYECLKLLISAGVRDVFYRVGKKDERVSDEYLRKMNIRAIQ